ncbi:MAG TPA: metallophosphoesterase [Candidatus Akkermansia intestinigallinarum]|uniref:Metallophosphoesterase n=1 Tax=Candidatus Akkermansia intestinigallinarum TaxID=2838431 RepID=A0A9D2AHD8_9BACT|nr:metallophosphoesterase [Candidatus Akkermansia intestinigallinarum]
MVKHIIHPLLLSLALTVCLFLALCCAVYAESRSLSVDTYTVPIEQWADDLQPVRIAVIADLHVKRWDKQQMADVVEAIREAKPDLIMLAGDYVEGVRRKDAMPIDDIAAALAPLADIAPTYYVLGNHDLSAPAHHVKHAFNKVGFTFVEGQRLRLTLSHGRSMDLQGVGYYESENKPLNKLFSQPRDAAVPLVVLCHTPIGFDVQPLDLDLVIAGHTHGGQICNADGVPLVSLHGMSTERLRAGLKKTPNGRHLFITRGIGWSRAPLRLHCRPEVAILELR